MGYVPNDQGSHAQLTPSLVKKHFDRYVVGQEEAKLTVATAVATHYRRLARNGLHGGKQSSRSNILLMGPTGSGKTLLSELTADSTTIRAFG